MTVSGEHGCAIVLGAPVLGRVARGVPVVPHAAVDLVTTWPRLVGFLRVETVWVSRFASK
jgi:hypothetical protein